MPAGSCRRRTGPSSPTVPRSSPASCIPAGTDAPAARTAARAPTSQRSTMSHDHEHLTRRQILQYGGSAVAAATLAGITTANARAAATGASALVDLNKPAAPFPHVWERVVGGDWAKQALRRDYQDHLLAAHR